MSTAPEKFNIVQFQAASGLPLTADFIVKTLGIGPDETLKRAMWWNRDRYGLILGRLQNHINGKGALNPCTFDGSRTKPAEDAGTAAASTASTNADNAGFFGDDDTTDDFFGDAAPAAETEDNGEFF